MCGFKIALDVVAPLVPQPQPACPLLPAKGALCHSAKASRLLTALNAAPHQPRLDPALSQAPPQLLVIVSLVRMHLLRAVARSAPLAAHKRDRVYDRHQLLTIRHVRARKHRGKRQIVLVYRLMALCPRPAPVHRRRADRLADSPPFFAPFARTKMLSTLARLQSIRCAASSFASRVSCSRC